MKWWGRFAVPTGTWNALTACEQTPWDATRDA